MRRRAAQDGVDDAFARDEGEGDRTLGLPDVWLEDELWTTLRLDPAALPAGEVRMLPGTVYQRLSHTAFEPQEATATVRPDSADAALRVYAVEYPALRRTLVSPTSFLPCRPALRKYFETTMSVASCDQSAGISAPSILKTTEPSGFVMTLVRRSQVT